MHSCLLWDDIIAAAVAVFDDRGLSAPFPLSLNIADVPAFGSGQIDVQIVKRGVPNHQVLRVRRTFETHRLVEFAAIAVAGLGLFAAGRHQIRDVALRGSSADYLIDDENYLLEVAGRSRRADLQSAWDVRWNRLADHRNSGFFVCVSEFETPSARLAYAK